jgi:hypothetical protein
MLVKAVITLANFIQIKELVAGIMVANQHVLLVAILLVLRHALVDV